jgi:O-antigen ligase
MNKALANSKSTEMSPVRWVLGSLTAITLYFQTNLNDPFNSPKLWILLIVASWLIGYIVRFRNIILANKDLKITLYIVLTFIFSAFLATLFSDFKYIAFIGETQRRNGFLAYLSLSIILLASSIVIRTFNIKRLFVMTYFIAAITVVYAAMQISGNDFVKWNNPYNAIIGTVGNPNFAAAVMAIMGVIVFSSIFSSSTPFYLRFFGVILVISILGLVYKSNARQGLLAYALGVGIFLTIWIFGKNRNLGIATAIGGVVTFIFAVLGMLQIGPLEKFLYKPSVSVRGHYWRTGIEMLKDNPFFGVGMDRYGAFFKEYRDVSYPLSYGFDITSTNAHNTFIQFFATGGIFLGTSYLVLNGYIFRRAIIGLKNTMENDRLLLGGIFSAWIAFHAQSLVSIDNIGISIWGWVLGGSIIGLSISGSSSEHEDRKKFIGRKNEINLGRVSTSSIAAGLAIVLVTILYRGESNSFNSRVNVNLQDQFMVSTYRDLQLKAINSPLIDPNYSLNCAINLIKAGFTDEGLEIARKIHMDDPRNLDAINGLALTSEQLNRIPDAIIYRLKMTELDPWNAVNYLELGKDYKLLGDFAKSKEMLDKIMSFAAGVHGGPIVDQAKIELAQ